jgi:hypothetical protein
VRRAIERDSRFTVVSRVVTSRDVSTVAGRAPTTLRDRDVLSSFDAIVVGAPDALSAADVAGLEEFMRRRGGSVVLLLDGRTPGAHDRLMNAGAWGASSTTVSRLALTQDDSSTLRSTETVWPNPLPPGATTVVSGDRPAVWQTPIGAGRLIVCGALDAWRFRDPASSAFDRFWRTLVADAASSAPPPLAVTASASIGRPGELVDLDVVVRDAALAVSAPVTRASVAATLEPRTPVVLWPEGDVGHFSAQIRAPREAATHRIVVNGEGGSTDVPLVVTPDAHRADGWSPALLEAWAVARGGKLVQAGDIGRLADLLSETIRPPSRLVTWHPLRSVWWLVPFGLALSGEWWLRRRRGLR